MKQQKVSWTVFLLATLVWVSFLFIETITYLKTGIAVIAAVFFLLTFLLKTDMIEITIVGSDDLHKELKEKLKGGKGWNFA